MDCLVANDFYAVHFSALQQGRHSGEATEFVKYCQEVPKVGKLFLTVDLLDRDVRATPVSLAVVEEDMGVDGRPPRIKRTLAETPPKIYKNGIADTHVDIARPGHYAVIATIGAESPTEDDRLRIPFSVGLPLVSPAGNALGRVTAAACILFFSVMAVIGYRTWRFYRPKKARPVEAPAVREIKVG